MSDFYQTGETLRLNQTEKRLAAWVREPKEEEFCLLLASVGALACIHELQLSHLGSSATNTGEAGILMFLPLPPLPAQ